jgi:GT2 family glycosyltransferase
MIIQEVKMQDLTIIILTYNSSQTIRQCLCSFNNHNYQVIVIDNASCDDTIKIIEENFPLVKIIQNHTNIGFGRANNIALNQVNTNYALILNPDTIIKDEAINNCLNILSNNHEVALGSPVILNQETVNFVNKNTEKFSYTNFIVGGVLFINMKNIKKIGLFDEQFFMFAEDSDLSDRSIFLGYKNIIINNCYAVHFGGKSSQKSLHVTYRRFWHLGWSKTKYKQKRKNTFHFIRSSLRLTIAYFFTGLMNLIIFNKEKAVSKFAFSFGCFSCLIGLKAFKNNKPRGEIPLFLKLKI